MGLVKPLEIEDCLRRHQSCMDMAEVCSGVDLIIEAVSENLPLKRAVFSDLERLTASRIIQQRDKALLRLTDIVKGLAREQKK